MVVRNDVALFRNDYSRSQRGYFLLSRTLIQKTSAKKQFQRVDRHSARHSSCCCDAYNAGYHRIGDFGVLLVEPLQYVDRTQIQGGLVSRRELLDFYLALAW